MICFESFKQKNPGEICLSLLMLLQTMVWNNCFLECTGDGIVLQLELYVKGGSSAGAPGARPLFENFKDVSLKISIH